MEPVAWRTPLHCFSNEKAVLPHNGQNGCDIPRSLSASDFQLQGRTGRKRGRHVSADPPCTLLKCLKSVHQGFCDHLWGQGGIAQLLGADLGCGGGCYPCPPVMQRSVASASDGMWRGWVVLPAVCLLIPVGFPRCAGGIIFSSFS